MDVDNQIYNFTLLPENVNYVNNKEYPKYFALFITLTSILSMVLFCFFVEGVIAKANKLFSSEKPKRSAERSKIKSVSILSVIKHWIQCKFDLMHTSRSLLNAYGLAWKVNLFGLKEIVFLHDPVMLQKLYMSWEPSHLHKPNFLYDRALVGPFKAGLISCRANVWKSHRTAVCKGFSYNSLKTQVKLFNEYGKKLVNRLNEEPFYSQLNWSADFHKGNFSRIMNETAFDIISHIALGKEGILSANETKRIHESYHRIKQLISYRTYHPFLAPDLFWSIHPKGRELNKILGITDEIFDKILRVAKKENIKNKDENRNSENALESGVVSLVDEMVKGELSDEEILSELYTFILAGQEAVCTIISMTIFHLAANAKYQKNCQEEVDQLFSEMMATNQQEISMEAINNLTYLDRCIKEDLRLYPTTPIIGRQLESPITLDENTTLKAGTSTLTSLWLLHRNKDHFPDPEKFDPDRFLPENSTERKLCEYMPYSIGPRNCIGGKSGTLEVKVLLAYILYNFELSTDATVEDLRDAFEKCIWPPPELPVRLIRRR